MLLRSVWLLAADAGKTQFLLTKVEIIRSCPKIAVPVNWMKIAEIVLSKIVPMERRLMHESKTIGCVRESHTESPSSSTGTTSKRSGRINRRREAFMFSSPNQETRQGKEC